MNTVAVIISKMLSDSDKIAKYYEINKLTLNTNKSKSFVFELNLHTFLRRPVFAVWASRQPALFQLSYYVCPGQGQASYQHTPRTERNTRI